jgi:hypothetical protein
MRYRTLLSDPPGRQQVASPLGLKGFEPELLQLTATGSDRAEEAG